MTGSHFILDVKSTFVDVWVFSWKKWHWENWVAYLSSYTQINKPELQKLKQKSIMEGLFSRSQNVAGFSKNDHLSVGVFLWLCSFCSCFINALALLQMTSDGFLFCAVLSGFHIRVRIPSYNKLWHFPSFPKLGIKVIILEIVLQTFVYFFPQQYPVIRWVFFPPLSLLTSRLTNEFLYIHVSVFSYWFLCPETLTLKSLMALLLSEIRSLRLILYFYFPGPVNSHFPVKPWFLLVGNGF